MAISIVGSNAAQNYGTQVTVIAVSGIQDGDILVGWVFAHNTEPGLPSGFTDWATQVTATTQNFKLVQE